MITSNRKFGVEIEFYASDIRGFSEVQRRLNTHRDGSLDGREFGSEYISRPLQGSSGEKELRKHCKILEENRCESGDVKTSVHVHHDGRRDDIEIKEIGFEERGDGITVGVSKKIMRTLNKNELERLISGQPILLLTDILRSRVDNVIYYSYLKRTKHPTRNFVFYSLKTNDRFNWLRNVFYFYTQYSDIIESIVNNSRKMGNMYCIPLGSAYSLIEIENCNYMNDLMMLWYRGKLPEGRYDDSRYKNVNLHSFWGGNGTVEIRSHGGTIDADKILLWVRLHQYILDKLEDMELDDVKMKTPDQALEFIKFISDDELLVAYTKRLLGYFSGIKLN